MAVAAREALQKAGLWDKLSRQDRARRERRSGRPVRHHRRGRGRHHRAFARALGRDGAQDHGGAYSRESWHKPIEHGMAVIKGAGATPRKRSPTTSRAARRARSWRTTASPCRGPEAEPTWIGPPSRYRCKLAFWTCVLILPVAVLLARRWRGGGFRGKSLVEALVMLPLVLPPTVLGFYLLSAFSPASGFGAFLKSVFGVPLVFSFRRHPRRLHHHQPAVRGAADPARVRGHSPQRARGGLRQRAVAHGDHALRRAAARVARHRLGASRSSSRTRWASSASS